MACSREILISRGPSPRSSTAAPSLATSARAIQGKMIEIMPGNGVKAPLRAITLGKRCLRYLSGMRGHGSHLSSLGALRPVRGGAPVLEGFADASYEEGYAQTGVLCKCAGMTVSWKSPRRVQVPRSTAEADITAMAYAPQHLEGITALYQSMRVPV